MSRHQENKKTIPFVFINPGDTIGEIDYEGQSDLRVFACKALQDSYLLYFKSHDINSINGNTTEIMGLLLDNSSKKLDTLKQMEREIIEKTSAISYGFKSASTPKLPKPKLIESKSNLEIIEEASDGKESESINDSNNLLQPSSKIGKMILSKLTIIESMIGNIANKNESLNIMKSYPERDLTIRADIKP